MFCCLFELNGALFNVVHIAKYNSFVGLSVDLQAAYSHQLGYVFLNTLVFGFSSNRHLHHVSSTVVTSEI